jgi:hypothetical protein
LDFFLLFAVGTLAADLRWRGRRPSLRGGHHVLGDAVRLMLKRIVDFSDNEFRLNGAGPRRWENMRHLKQLGTARRKDRDFAKIPRQHHRSAGDARGIVLTLVRTRLVRDCVPALRQEVGHRLIADCPLEQWPLRRSLSRP